MEYSGLPAASDQGDLPWSDSQSMSSDDGFAGDILIPGSPSPSDAAAAAAAWVNHTGQLSPISPGMDLSSMNDVSAPPMAHSASSSCTESWSVGLADGDDDAAHWQHCSDDLTVPKLEPLDDDDVCLEDLKEAPDNVVGPDTDITHHVPKIKRPRGRPRKHPVQSPVGSSKVTKGRSKTGCITCRKRKKKCDEAKPRCMNCEKNAVLCEGYHEKQIWKSGKEKAEEERLRRESLPVITLQPIFHAVETAEDKMFWRHYCSHFSNVLTVEGEAKNAFKDIILQLAIRHQGLMHSLLAVSSKHIDYGTPYGMKLLQDNPNSSLESLQERSDYHHDEAMKRFYEDINRAEDKDDPEYKTILSARYGQMLCLVLQTMAEGNPRGDHRVHLQAYKSLIQHSPPEDPTFLAFITEFFQYHIYADELIWHPDMPHKRLASEHWLPPVPIHPPRLIGVADGLFRNLWQITTLRNTIRDKLLENVDPAVGYPSFYQASDIDDSIRLWNPNWPPGDSRDRVALLYKQMMWVHLFRTVYPPDLSSPLPGSGSSTMPDMSLSMTTAAGTHMNMIAPETINPLSSPVSMSSCSSRNPSRTSSMHEHDGPTSSSPHRGLGHTRTGSPPPIRRPSQHDRRVTVAVEEALMILDTFKACDPAQTLLLMPCLVVGAACFTPPQQERIRNAVKAVRGYTGLRNCDRVSELLEELWLLMKRGDWLAVWDWQGVAMSMETDFLCT